MLSSVTLNCQVTNIVMNPGSQLSELKSVSQMSQVTKIVKNCKNCPKKSTLLKLSKLLKFVKIVSCPAKEIIWANSKKAKKKVKDKII